VIDDEPQGPEEFRVDDVLSSIIEVLFLSGGKWGRLLRIIAFLAVVAGIMLLIRLMR